MKAAIPCSILLGALGAACGNGGSTSPSTTTTSVPAAPTTAEAFTGTLPVGGSAVYPFTVSAAGTVNVTLTSVGGSGVPSTVQVRLGIGAPGDGGCTLSVSSVISAGTTPQVTAAEQPGAFCAGLFDVGNLFAPAAFTLTVDHP